ncbi:MAG: hypothetical protein JSU01_16265 [Bacteroidetes bacterium]|nr:hypothetical protein [Bacteroidota bacterium]
MKILKKSVFIFFALCLSSFQQDKTKRFFIVAYRDPEIMYGNIKQVIELRPDKIEGEEPHLCPYDTTSFDKNGNPIETRLGIKKGRCLLISYKTKYDRQGKKQETMIDDGHKMIYMFNDKGYIVRSEYYSTSSYLLDYNTYEYNSAGEIIESQSYRGQNDSKPTKTKFEFDLDGMLSSISGDRWHRTYQYLSTDAKGNWTKRTITDHTLGRVNVDTVICKIAYY